MPTDPMSQESKIRWIQVEEADFKLSEAKEMIILLDTEIHKQIAEVKALKQVSTYFC